MGKTGRPQEPMNPIAAERIKSLRERHRETQETIAKILGNEAAPYSSASVGRYERMTRGIPKAHLVKLAEHWNVPLEYLTGETDISDPIAYQLDRERSITQGFIEAVEQHERAVQTPRLTNMFDLCGFDYSFLLQNQGEHKIVDQCGIIDDTILTENELSELIESIHKAIAFELFCIQKARESDGDS